MKKITLALMMFAGLMVGCSTDDETLFNEENVVPTETNVGILSDPPLEGCADTNAIGGNATLSSYTGMQITFNWNNIVEYDVDKTYVSYIEIVEDAACPAPAGAAAVASTYPIDVFNTSSLVLPAGVSAKCFNWRIVVNGYTGSDLTCTVTTEWKPATYVQ
jgi:hypothetical protein